MIAVTTSTHPPPTLETQAKSLAVELTAPYIARLGRGLSELATSAQASRLLIVGTDRLRLRDTATGTEYFYHPNMFQIRAAGALRGEPDHFLQATELRPGESLLDCTLGFASEAALAALTVGETGSVVGLESNRDLALITRLGLQSFHLQRPAMEAALRRVQVAASDYRDTLHACEARSFDVVYFDPFFPERLAGSEASVSPLFVFGNQTPLDPEAVREARRVARRSVVIKHPSQEPLPSLVRSWVTKTVGGRKSRLTYSVIDVTAE